MVPSFPWWPPILESAVDGRGERPALGRGVIDVYFRGGKSDVIHIDFLLAAQGVDLPVRPSRCGEVRGPNFGRAIVIVGRGGQSGGQLRPLRRAAQRDAVALVIRDDRIEWKVPFLGIGVLTADRKPAR